ncbi:MAG: DUF1223 domain-containing protein [Parvularculaceae bacterium]
MRFNIRSHGAVLIYVAGAALVAPGLSRAQAPDAKPPVVVEMFTSQACKQCPPAVELLGKLYKRPDLVVLNWHIDYWNLLSSGKHGRWRDPYSKPEYSERQRVYNRNIRRRRTVFTPQAIIDGATSVIGSKEEALEIQIRRERAYLQPIAIDFTVEGGNLSVTIDKQGPDRADVYFVSFHDWKETPVKGGDNAGLVFREPNIVAGMMRLGGLAYRAETFTVPAPEAGMGCAIIIQERDQGPILGGRYCP